VTMVVDDGCGNDDGDDDNGLMTMVWVRWAR
jgi:hypothetical protein